MIGDYSEPHGPCQLKMVRILGSVVVLRLGAFALISHAFLTPLSYIQLFSLFLLLH